MTELTDAEWTAISRRNARSVQTTIGWIFWDPGAVRRYEARGLGAGLGYIASRGAPFAGAGPDALNGAFGSISSLGIRLLYLELDGPEKFMEFWHDRNEAVLDGLQEFAPEIIDPLRYFGPLIWDVVTKLPTAGRPFSASHLALDIPDDPVLSAWHAVNYLREWRGDTHWALVATNLLSGGEASILHNAWLGYEGDWLSNSRGNSKDEIDAAWSTLEDKGLATSRSVTDAGLRLRQEIEDETDQLSSLPWKLLGHRESVIFAEEFEPACEKLLTRVDVTAGVNYQPASRIRPIR